MVGGAPSLQPQGGPEQMLQGRLHLSAERPFPSGSGKTASSQGDHVGRSITPTLGRWCVPLAVATLLGQAMLVANWPFFGKSCMRRSPPAWNRGQVSFFLVDLS